MEVTFIKCSDMQASWGSGDDPRKFLKSRETYKVVHIEVHTNHTLLHLEGVHARGFNSVCFVGNADYDDAIEQAVEEWQWENE